LLHLLAMSARPYITLRIVPTDIGAHAGLGGSFVQLKYYKYEPAVFAETSNPGLLVEDKGSLAAYELVLKHLGQQALDEDRSRKLITSLLPD
jgi:hypothetical protein